MADLHRAAFAADYLRKTDPERYFATLILPDHARPAVQSLYAFSADVASVRERVTNPGPGEIRLQWWDDALAGQGHGDVRKNPLADALLSTIGKYGLSTVPLRRLIAARRFDLYDDPMPDLNSFEGYAGETVSALYQYAAVILNEGRPVEPGDAAGHLGVAHALVGHLRAFPHNASKARIFLPWSILAANGVGEADVFSGDSTPQLVAALGQLRELARGHIGEARKAIAALPKATKPAFAPIALLDAQLRRLEKSRELPFDLVPDLSDWRKIMLLALWSWRQR